MSDMVEVPNGAPAKDEDTPGIIAVGLDGGTDEAAMLERARRMQNCLSRVMYRECISCDRCANCLELREFTKSGRVRVKALYCLANEIETDANHTCDVRREQRHDRRKVVYDLTNAPIGFKLTSDNLKSQQVDLSRNGSRREAARTIMQRTQGYMGGSGAYQRTDGGEKGSGVMPKGLAN